MVRIKLVLTQTVTFINHMLNNTNKIKFLSILTATLQFMSSKIIIIIIAISGLRIHDNYT